mmetsp:Transcript_294/g.706  ORF Transcript_294/g.706 Transcript_294/m.706 type:complete len:209 (-) Transcript_294:579-1205(-)
MELGHNSMMNRSFYDCAPLELDLADVADLQNFVVELTESPIQSGAGTPSMDAVLGAQFGSDLIEEVPTFGTGYTRNEYSEPDFCAPSLWMSPEDGGDHVYSDLSQSSELSDDHSRDTTEEVRASEHKMPKKTIAKRSIALWEKRAIEAQKFPADLLGDISGTTSSKVKDMSPEERELVLFKRKLRNRESARRSRERRRMMERLKNQKC